MRSTALPIRLLAVACLLLFAAAIPAAAQKKKNTSPTPTPTPTTVSAEANEAGTLEQCRNGATAPGAGCVTLGGNTGWVTGNAGFQNSHWAEDQFLPYRILFSNLSTTPNNTKTVIIGYDIIHSNVHAIDYLGTYNFTEKNNDPCVGVEGCVLGSPTSTFPVPEDTVTVTSQINPNTSDPITQIPGEFTMWGGTILGVAYLPYTPGDVERRIAVTFRALVSNPVLAWGGHVAWQGDWGAGNSAGGISGSPYHMRFVELDGQGGNQDRSLSADAVLPSGALFIVKEVETFDGTDSSTQAFSFNVSRDFAQLSFDLVDDNEGPGIDTASSSGITLFGPSNMITVTESSVFGWQLLGINCVENQTQNSVVDLANNRVNVAVDLNEIVTCTFTNGQIGASAADSSISGYVTDQSGRAISGAQVQVFNALTGDMRTAHTNSFGYYRFDALETGDAYMVDVAANGYSFATETLTVQGDHTVDFVAN